MRSPRRETVIRAACGSRRGYAAGHSPARPALVAAGQKTAGKPGYAGGHVRDAAGRALPRDGVEPDVALAAGIPPELMMEQVARLLRPRGRDR